MKLEDCELIPAVIYSIKDPEKLGRIKCIIPGIIDNTTMSEENIPWVRPIGMNRQQSFSMPVVGYKVWVLINKANYNEYWYFPFFEKNDITDNYLSDDVYESGNAEVLVSHNKGGTPVKMTYDDINGYNIQLGSNHIQMNTDGVISIVGGECDIKMKGGVITIGNGGNAQFAVKGDELKNILDQLKIAMQKLQGASQGMLSPLAPGFATAAQVLNTSNILAEHVKVN